MKAHEILQRFSKEAASEIFQYLYTRTTNRLIGRAYRCSPRAENCVPSFWSEKLCVERHAWMHAELARKPMMMPPPRCFKPGCSELISNWSAAFSTAWALRTMAADCSTTAPRAPERAPAGGHRPAPRKSIPIRRDRLSPLVLRNGHCRLADPEKILSEDSRLCLAPQRLAA